MAHQNGYVAFDLDGTLAEYEGWKGVEHIGAPIPAMIEKAKAYLAAGVEVRIMTARVSGPGTEKYRIAGIIQDWVEQHLGERVPVTCCKDFNMITLYDDRCISVEENTGRILGGREPDVLL